MGGTLGYSSGAEASATGDVISDASQTQQKVARSNTTTPGRHGQEELGTQEGSRALLQMGGTSRFAPKISASSVSHKIAIFRDWWDKSETTSGGSATPSRLDLEAADRD